MLATASQSTTTELIVINDASPEPEVTNWLRERAAPDDRVFLLENTDNLGFVGTVNRGMALSTNDDVLLLNSDTEVANDWLDRIRNAAIWRCQGSVWSPVLQQRNHLQLPRFCKDNNLKPAMTPPGSMPCVPTNPGVVVDVPTGVGFVCTSAATAWREMNLFDTENFGKGHGELDFCQRAAEAGWHNRTCSTPSCCTPVVPRRSSKSPGRDGNAPCLHPRYESAVMAFVRETRPGISHGD